MIETDKELLLYLSEHKDLDAIVVEGYDGVGKGRVLDMLARLYSTTPYRPDYNLWQQYDHRQIDRWKVSGFFWDVYSHFGHQFATPMLFDRGVISGAVYNHDKRIARDYPSLIRDMKILHILVVCSNEDHAQFLTIRNPHITAEEITESIRLYQEYTEEYLDCLEESGVRYIIYRNKFNKDESKILSETCAGCGHYSYGWCRHPEINLAVDGSCQRCDRSSDKEVQDINDSEMLCV